MMLKADLAPGDILVFEWNGNPYHTAIYAPLEGRMGDVIHMGNGFMRAGAVCGTLEGMVYLHQNLTKCGNRWNYSSKPHSLEINVFRSKTLLGREIAAQARFWLEQGVPYDQKRLAQSVRDQHLPPSFEEEEKNILTYLKYSARRLTAPIKTPFFPNCAESFRATFGSFFMAPVLNLPKWLERFGLWCMFRGTRDVERTKGFTCAGFVLACIAAVALKDEIAPVTSKTGWVSLKNTAVSEDNQTAFGRVLQRVKASFTKKTSKEYAGFDRLLSVEQQQKFDIERLKQKLSFLAQLDPHRPSILAFKAGIRSASTHWDKVGELCSFSLNREFDKKRYQLEKKQDLQTAQTNHQVFGQAFKLSFSSRGPTLFQRIVSRCTGEAISNIHTLSK